MNKKLEDARTSYNRSVYASPLEAASGLRSPRSVATLVPTAHYTQILGTCKPKSRVRIVFLAFWFAYPAPKTSQTAGTLCVILPWLLWNNHISFFSILSGEKNNCCFCDEKSQNMYLSIKWLKPRIIKKILHYLILGILFIW